MFLPALGMPVVRTEIAAPCFDAAPSIVHLDLLAVHDDAEVGFEGRRLELRLRHLGLLQKLLGALTLRVAAAGEQERRADDEGEEADHGPGIGAGR